jgi:hypothetical protein
VLLRFPDLQEYGVRNWVTLRRWIEKEGFPSGFYLAENSRAWHKADCDRWLANRPKAGPPPEINEPAAASPAREVSNGRETKAPKQHPSDTDSVASVQALPKREGE